MNESTLRSEDSKIPFIIGMSMAMPSLIVGLITCLIIPKFEQIFIELAIELPALTEFVVQTPTILCITFLLAIGLWPPLVAYLRNSISKFLGLATIINAIILSAISGLMVCAIFLPLSEIIVALD